jgi:hypothetical protein
MFLEPTNHIISITIGWKNWIKDLDNLAICHNQCNSLNQVLILYFKHWQPDRLGKTQVSIAQQLKRQMQPQLR